MILTDDRLTDAQKQSMLDVYRAFLAANDAVLPPRLTIRARGSASATSRPTASTMMPTVVASIAWPSPRRGLGLGAVDEHAGDTAGAQPWLAHIVNSVAASIS